MRGFVTKTAIGFTATALILTSGSAYAETTKPSPKPSPSQHSPADQQAVKDYLAKRKAALAASRARKATRLKVKIAKTRKAIAQARVDGAKIMTIAAKYKGVPYRLGGSTPSGFDCSGYTSYVFRQAGITLPRIAQQQYKWSKRITLAQAKPGDLAFYMSGNYAYHAAIYAGNGMIWHSPRPGERVVKVKIRNHKMAYGRLPASAVVPALTAQLKRDTAALKLLVKPTHKVKKKATHRSSK
mgnify:CR=1 FL=1